MDSVFQMSIPNQGFTGLQLILEGDHQVASGVTMPAGKL
jgi:hypothetical protein